MFQCPAMVAPEKAVFRPALPSHPLPGLSGTDMGTMTYGEQLKHPNWQRRRLDMLTKAGWMCQRCCSMEDTLHVHHKGYVKGRMVWEYQDNELLVVCNECHTNEHELMGEVQKLLRETGVSLHEVHLVLLGYLTMGPAAGKGHRKPSVTGLGCTMARVGWLAGNAQGLPEEALAKMFDLVEQLWVIESKGASDA